MSEAWTSEMDGALVQHINSTCTALAIAPARLHAHEVYLTQAELASAEYSLLQGKRRRVFVYMSLDLGFKDFILRVTKIINVCLSPNNF